MSNTVEQPTATEQVRREQIIRATIATLAERGYAGTSYAQIARRSGLSSTGLISYHFANKDDLMFRVVTTVMEGIGTFVSGRMASVSSPRDALETYILATTSYIGDHRQEMRALLEVVLNGLMQPGMDATQAAEGAVDGILRAGQEAGQFRDFDVTIMASVIQRSIEGLPMLLASHPTTDPQVYGRELVALFDRATRREETE
jgi:AcrR family transcriptional regulator